MNLIVDNYKKVLIHRWDDNGYTYYFSADDFPGLNKEPFSFVSDGNQLVGNYYFYEGAKEDTLVIFCHGIGGGHRSYMVEIERLCQAGYKVLAYDNTGCFDSEGESILTLTKSLSDLDHAIQYLKDSGEWMKYQHIYAIGHSWGGYAVGNIGNYQSGIEKCIVMSGFVSLEQFLSGYIHDDKGVPKRIILKAILKYEKEQSGKYYSSSSLDVINQKISQYLLVHSTDDPTVPYDLSANYIQSNTTNDEVQYLIVEGKYHNPNYMADAVQYMGSVFGEFEKKKLKKLDDQKAFFQDVDWRRMTMQDEEVWEKILAFLQQ